MSGNRSMTLAEFWPHYVLAHQRPATRAFHFLATLVQFVLLAAFFLTWRWLWLVALPVASYGLAWFSHFALEHNRPATWEHPVLSWLADQKMCALMLAGRMDSEVERARLAIPEHS